MTPRACNHRPPVACPPRARRLPLLLSALSPLAIAASARTQLATRRLRQPPGRAARVNNAGRLSRHVPCGDFMLCHALFSFFFFFFSCRTLLLARRAQQKSRARREKPAPRASALVVVAARDAPHTTHCLRRFTRAPPRLSRGPSSLSLSLSLPLSVSLPLSLGRSALHRRGSRISRRAAILVTSPGIL